MKTKVNIRLLDLYGGESGAPNDCFLLNVCSEKQILPTMFYYSRLPITRTFKGNLKKVRVIGSSKKIAESKVTNRFYCTVNILITFNGRNVK